jgi:hypothetical protein
VPRFGADANYSENDYVTVLNCSLIRGREAVCRRPDSLVSRAAVRYSEGPRFESRSGFTLKKYIYSLMDVFQSLLVAKKVFCE